MISFKTLPYEENEEELLTYNLYSKEVTLRRKINEIKNDKDDSSNTFKIIGN